MARAPRAGAGSRGQGAGTSWRQHPGRRRCAIYTRKSSEEGLEQSFNSLDAQREACEAYIASQRHEGWLLIPTAYDDGGLSGGTLERPALQRLLADIRAGKVDLVVVYKVDRLTRSLADFAKIVEVFDAQNVSFVSVTQQFNTTTSMGRLTLNMLLSFAQFEREVTGERIRDKVAASKRKGMWMGGYVPLGYDLSGRKLVVNEAEAEMVRHIFRSYLRLGSVQLLEQELAAEGIRSKARPWLANERMQGGRPLARGALYTLLQNRVYRGEVAHQGLVYPGEQEAIVDQALWDAVQEQLRQNRQGHRTGRRAQQLSLLAGLLYDEIGCRLTPSHAVKSGKRYRYYISQAPKAGRRGRPSSDVITRRIPAADLEALVVERIRRWLASPREIAQATAATAGQGQTKRLLQEAEQLAQRWERLSMAEARAVLLKLLRRVEAHPDRVDLHLQPDQLWAVLEGEGSRIGHSQHAAAAAPQILSVKASLRRAGIEMALVVDGAEQPARIDPALIRLLSRAHALHERFIQAEDGTLAEFAAREGLTKSWVTRMVRLAYLAPEIVVAILEGRQPMSLTANKLLKDTRLPIEWQQQRRMLSVG